MPDVIILKEMHGFCDTTRIIEHVPLEISFNALYNTFANSDVQFDIIMV